MKYIAFESGSRAGLSTELFFKQYLYKAHSHEDLLYLSDKDSLYSKIISDSPYIKRIDDNEALSMLSKDCTITIFPADELTRQTSDAVRQYALQNPLSSVKEEYYNKAALNQMLRSKAKSILVPKTFELTDVFVKPNTQSAGSRNAHEEKNLCVSEKIDIEHEFVVDCYRNSDDDIKIYPREVILKNGYDRFIKLLPTDGYVADSVYMFVKSICEKNEGLFSHIFHLQIAQDKKGRLWYIESSKRISGSSIVNSFRGFNPFMLINKIRPVESCSYGLNEWLRFEDFLTLINEELYG